MLVIAHFISFPHPQKSTNMSPIGHVEFFSQNSFKGLYVRWYFGRSCPSFAFPCSKPAQRISRRSSTMASALTRSTHLSNPIGCHETRFLYVLREQRVHEAPFSGSWFLRLLRYTSRSWHCNSHLSRVHSL